MQDVPDVALLDENTGVMDALGETELVDASLETALQEVLDLESEHVIELHAGFVEHTDTDETANEGVAFEQALGVFLFEGEKFTVIYSISALESNMPQVESRHGKVFLYEVITYRAARRILDKVSMTRQTSRLFRRPYSPTVFNSESLYNKPCQCTYFQTA